MNNERLSKIITDMQECIADIDECIEVLEKFKDNEIMMKLAKSSLRQLFISFHTILEDLSYVILKELKKFKIGITLSDSLLLIREKNIIDEETYMFLEKSRLMRNRNLHRYKEPKHDELFTNITNYRGKLDIMVLVAKSYLE